MGKSCTNLIQFHWKTEIISYFYTFIKSTKTYHNMERRDFIGKSALAAGAFTIIPQSVRAGDKKKSIAPSDKINLGYIGVGKQSLHLLNALAACPETMVLAACDVDINKLERFKGLAEKANATDRSIAKMNNVCSLSKNAKCKARNFRAMRRTHVRRSSTKIVATPQLVNFCNALK